MTNSAVANRPKKTLDPGSRPPAHEVIKWIEKYCRVPEGRDVGKPVVLRGWQRDELRRIYDNPVGTRRAILSFGRKNSKTTFSAFLLLCHLAGPAAKPNSQLYSAAQSRDQAALLFNLATKMVRMHKDLDSFITVRESAKQLVCGELGTVYRALSAEATTAYGLSPAFIVHDELGQVRGPSSELYEALETATGAQDDPLSVVISTQAPTDADLLSVLIDDAKEGYDPRTVVSLYTAPMDADPFDEATIKKANPAFGDFLNAREVLEMAETVRRMPSRESEFRNLVLNQRVEARSPFVSASIWNACGTAVSEFDKSTPLYGGLDLSEVNDLTAFVLIGRIDGIWHVKPTFWLPEEGIYDRAKKDHVPYDEWHRNGLLATIPGRSIDYEYVAEWVFNQFELYNIRKIAFDRWNWRHLKPWLIRVGMPEEIIENCFLEFGQGFQSMSPALRDLEGELLNARIAHGGHPILKAHAANAVVQRDPAGNRKLSKSKSTGRIDGMVALAMAIGAAPMEEQEIDAWTMVV